MYRISVQYENGFVYGENGLVVPSENDQYRAYVSIQYTEVYGGNQRVEIEETIGVTEVFGTRPEAVGAAWDVIRVHSPDLGASPGPVSINVEE